ncbi:MULTISPECIES: hypothetical protein [unclassified Clostridium]|uniref:hypothetical protein n=1 Tax=unclassified Clostridium TaxID=2614128 RepID=UPI0002979DBD|nr:MULTISPECIES: hypothetical protein [unclassified Clostridium]EKQ56252.1 MAG: hypothetical protein A370_02008 [Clostridium sp. Maddingley MBC34-26]
MIKALVTILVKLAEAKLEKAGIEAILLKNQNYFTEAKKIWDAGEENKRIAKTVEEKIISKIDQFNAAVLKKFPELSQKDIDDLRQAIGGAVNAGKEAVLDNSDLLKQLQDVNTQLQAENVSLKNQLSQVQLLIGNNSITQTIDSNQVSVSPTATDPVIPVQTAAQA